MNRTIASGFFSIFSGKVLVMLLGVLATPILYRLLGPSGFGEYAFVLSVFSLFMIVVSTGVGDGVRKFLPEDRRDPNWNEHVVGFYFRLAFVLAAAGSLLLAVAAHAGVVERFLGARFTSYFYLLAVLVFVGQYRTFVRRTLMGFGLERYSEPLNVFKKTVFVGSAILFVSLGHGVTGALIGDLLASLVVVLIGSVLLARHVSPAVVVKPTPSTFPSRELLSFNTMSILLILLMTSLYHVDVIMLQPLAGSEQVGYYKAALNFAEFLWFVPIAIQTVLVHSTSELWSKNRLDRVSELAGRSVRYTLLLTTLMAVGIAVLAPVAVPLYFGAEATPAIGPLLVLLPGAIGFAVARPLLAISQGKGDLAAPILATGAAAAINAGLNLALIPRYGMRGAAIATSVGYGSMFAFHLWSARRVGFDPLADARLGRVAFTALLSVLPIYYLSNVVGTGILALVVVPPLGLAIYVAIAIGTGALGGDETFEVLSSFPAPIGTAARRLERFVWQRRFKGDPGRLFHKALLVAGVLLLVAGVAFAVGGAGPPSPSEVVGSSPQPTDGDPTTEETVTGDTTTVPSTTAPPTAPSTPTDESTETTIPPVTTISTSTPAETGTAAPDPTTAPSPTETQSDTPTRSPVSTPEPTETTTTETTTTETTTATETTETTTETLTETPTPTETPTETATPTETQTETATSTETPTPTETTTETQTEPTDTPVETSTPTETRTVTETATETTTVADTPTVTETPTETETSTETTTETPTPDPILSLTVLR